MVLEQDPAETVDRPQWRAQVVRDAVGECVELGQRRLQLVGSSLAVAQRFLGLPAHGHDRQRRQRDHESGPRQVDHQQQQIGARSLGCLGLQQRPFLGDHAVADGLDPLHQGASAPAAHDLLRAGGVGIVGKSNGLAKLIDPFRDRRRELGEGLLLRRPAGGHGFQFRERGRNQLDVAFKEGEKVVFAQQVAALRAFRGPNQEQHGGDLVLDLQRLCHQLRVGLRADDEQDRGGADECENQVAK